MAKIAEIHKEKLIQYGHTVARAKYGVNAYCYDVVVLKTNKSVRFLCRSDCNITNTTEYVLYKTFDEVKQAIALDLMLILQQAQKENTDGHTADIRKRGYKKLTAIGKQEVRPVAGELTKFVIHAKQRYVMFYGVNRYMPFQIRVSFDELRERYKYDITPDITIKVTCYNKRETWVVREEAMKFYLECMSCSEGAEQKRYTNIYMQLAEGCFDCVDIVGSDKV